MRWHGSPYTFGDGDAAARLRYAADVRRRTRRRGAAPAFALLMLGGIMGIGGLLIGRWPHSLALAVVWCLAFVLTGPALQWHRRRAARRRGVEEPRRVRAVGVTTGLVSALAATALGPLGLVAGVTAGGALLSLLAALPVLAAAMIASGALVIGAIAPHVSSWTAMMVFGVSLVGFGLIAFGVERRSR